MVHPAMCIALLYLVALWGLVPIPHLLRLLTLHGGSRGGPLGAVVGIVANFPTLIASVAHRIVRCVGPHWGANWGHLSALLKPRAWGLLHWALELLTGMLKLRTGVLGLLSGALKLLLLLLLLAKIHTRASKAERCPLL